MFDRERFIEECLATLTAANSQAAVKEIVGRAVSSPADIINTLGVPVKAGIDVLHRSDDLTVLNVVWAPQMAIYPHDHRTWAVIGIYGGREDNSFYRRRKEGIGLEQVNGRSLLEKEAIALGDQAIHAVVNPMRAFTGAIHVYGGDFFAIPRSEWDSPEAAEQPYSVDRAIQTFEDANRRAQELLRAQP
jgi:predicted metal-dependent enzyme (double-stranded beta helix superfamily)